MQFLYLIFVLLLSLVFFFQVSNNSELHNELFFIHASLINAGISFLTFLFWF